MSDSRKWEELVGNPEAFGGVEKELWTKLELILCELLDELKKNGKIETVFVPSEIDDLGVVLKTMDNCSKSHNLILNIFEEKATQSFLETNRQFGFEVNDLAQLYIQTVVLGAILSSEFFRTIILFHTQGLGSPKTLRQLLKKLGSESAAPKSTPKLVPFMDIDFRNALAHGLFGYLNGQMVLYKNAKFEILDKMELSRFMIRAKKQNVATQCLIHIIAERKSTGFFT